VKPWSTERTVCARRDRLAQEREGVERIGATAEEFVGTEGDTEPLPDAPSPVGGCGSTRNDAGFDGNADNAKGRADFILPALR
jgi:hypothetical protein